MTVNIQPKKSSNNDWHSADIVAALKKAGYSFSSLSRKYGYARQTLFPTLYRKWPKGEELICEAIREGSEYPTIQPIDIWPSRFEKDGTRKHCKPGRKPRNVNKSSGKIHG